MNLYQPIKFKRWELSKWEKGFRMTNESGEFVLEEDRKTAVKQVYKYKLNWF